MPAMMPASDSLRIAADIAGLAAVAAAAGGTFKFTSEVLMGLCSAVQEMAGAERAKPEEDDESESSGWRERVRVVRQGWREQHVAKSVRSYRAEQNRRTWL